MKKNHQFELVFLKCLVQLMVFYFSHVNSDIRNREVTKYISKLMIFKLGLKDLGHPWRQGFGGSMNIKS